MADEQNVAQETPAEPKLIAPAREDVVDGRSVTFRWEGVEDVEDYHLQVATDTQLQKVVYEKEVHGATEYTPQYDFKADGTTYFWNVWAHNEAGWSGEEFVESFVSTTAEKAEAVAASPEPNDDEDYGPAGELVRAAAAEMAAETTGEEAYFAEERERGVAHEGVEAGQILGVALSVIAVIAMLVITLFVMVDFSSKGQKRAVREAAPHTELQKTETQATDKLHQYSIVDDQKEVYRIPIDQAMNIMVNEAYQQEERANQQAKEKLSSNTENNKQ